MALTKDQFQEIKKELDECKNPLIFHDDDPDGFASYLLFKRYKKDAKGMPIKSQPILDEKFIKKVEEYGPDKIFVLDIPMIEQDFAEQTKVPLIWIDHHGPYDIKGPKYFNPRISDKDDNLCTSYICYQVVKQDIWIAMIGIVGDWQYHDDVVKKLKEEYPCLLPENITTPEEALFNSPIGKLVKIISFIIKGETKDMKKCVDIMTRMQDPYEILDQTSEGGKFIYKKFERFNKVYEELLEEAKSKRTDSKILNYTYSGKDSFTKELSNEMLYLFPEKVIIIARYVDGAYKGSLRSRDLILPPIVKQCVEGLDGYGGGHEHACGFCMNEKDWEEFLKRFEEEVNK